MKRTIILVSFAALMIGAASNSIAATKTPEQIYEEADYVVKIKVFLSTESKTGNYNSGRAFNFGSGSIISCEKYGYCIITAWHIIENSTNTFYATIKESTTTQKIELIDGSADFDIAFLKFADQKFKPKSVGKIGNSSKLKVGAKIMAIGSTAFGDFWFSGDGYLYTRIIYPPPGKPYPPAMLFSTNLFFGYSGGPLLNENGEIIGISQRIMLLDDRIIGIGIPIDPIMEKMKEILK